MSKSVRNIMGCVIGASMCLLGSCHGSEPSTRQNVQSTVAVTATQEPVYEEGTMLGKRFPNANIVTNFGKEAKLKDVSSADYTLVVLCNTNSEGYRNVLNQLTLERGIENAIIDKQLAVVVVSMDCTLDELRLLSPSFPSIWRLTALTDGIGNVPTPFNPTMYLLDSKWNVVQQRPDIESVLKAVEKHNSQG